jgi:hypothetical protein
MQPDTDKAFETKDNETSGTEPASETTNKVFHFVFTVIVFLIMFYFYLKVIWLE